MTRFYKGFRPSESIQTACLFAVETFANPSFAARPFAYLYDVCTRCAATP
ncbi:hypothetical protein [Neisseria dumasiana]|nr:hypothetical protein [Neisseria dumasiana]